MGDSKHEEIAAWLRGRILAGEFETEPFPSERALVKATGHASPTVRCALAHLQGEGLIRAEHGVGWRVRDYLRNGEVPMFRHWLHALRDSPEAADAVREVLQLRKPLIERSVELMFEREGGEWLLAKDRVAALDRANSHGWPIEILVAESMVWMRFAEQALGKMQLVIAHHLERCLTDFVGWRRVPETIPSLKADWATWVDLLAAGDTEFLAQTKRMLDARDQLWVQCAALPLPEARSAV